MLGSSPWDFVKPVVEDAACITVADPKGAPTIAVVAGDRLRVAWVKVGGFSSGVGRAVKSLKLRVPVGVNSTALIVPGVLLPLPTERLVSDRCGLQVTLSASPLPILTGTL